MSIANEQTTSQITQLIGQLRDYILLQKDFWALNGAQVLTRLFSAIILWAILILVGFMIILFGSFALAYWIGSLMDNTILGFVIITGILFLLACLFYMNRQAWIVLPTTRFMISLLGSVVAYPTEEGIAMEQEHLTQKINESEEKMKVVATNLLEPIPAARNRWERASNLIMNGWNIYRGMQLGMSAIVAIRNIFGMGKKRR